MFQSLTSFKLSRLCKDSLSKKYKTNSITFAKIKQSKHIEPFNFHCFIVHLINGTKRGVDVIHFLFAILSNLPKIANTVYHLWFNYVDFFAPKLLKDSIKSDSCCMKMHVINQHDQRTHQFFEFYCWPCN